MHQDGTYMIGAGQMGKVHDIISSEVIVKQMRRGGKIHRRGANRIRKYTSGGQVSRGLGTNGAVMNNNQNSTFKSGGRIKPKRTRRMRRGGVAQRNSRRR